MTDPKHPSEPGAPELTRADQRFVARVADAWRAAPLSAERRVAFQARLDARIASRRAALPLRALAGAVAAAAAVWLVVAGLGSSERDGELRIARADDPRPVATESARAATAEEAILELSAEDDGEDESLPDDYAAIASLFLDS